MWWAPHLAPEEGYVIGQHVFRSPALIAARGPLVLAVVPDLDVVGVRPENPWFMDYDAPARKMWIGLVRTDIPEHVLFRKAPGMTFAPGKVELGFFVAAYVDAGAVKDPWAKASALLWERWGRPLYEKGEPVAGPLRSYVRRTYDWAFGGWGRFVWQEFDLGGRRVGAPQFIVNVSQSPELSRAVVPARVPVDLEPGLVLVAAERIGAFPLRPGDDRRGAHGQGPPDQGAGPGGARDAGPFPGRHRHGERRGRRRRQAAAAAARLERGPLVELGPDARRARHHVGLVPRAGHEWNGARDAALVRRAREGRAARRLRADLRRTPARAPGRGQASSPAGSIRRRTRPGR